MSTRTSLRVATASIPIEPAPGAPMQGYDLRRAVSVADSLRASGLAVGGERIEWLLLDVDAIGLDRRFVASVRRRIARRLHMSPHVVTIACSHTHSGGATLRRLGAVEGDRAYLRLLRDRLVAVAEKAAERLHPVRWRFGMVSLAENINRRQRVDGRIELGINSAGPVDHRLRVLRLDAEGGSAPVALIVHYACHATVSGGGLDLSSDWPGAMKRAVQDFYSTRSQRPGVHFLQGCSGDVTHRIGRDRELWPEHFGRHTAHEAGILGRRVAGAAVAASEQSQEFAAQDVRVATRPVKLPFADGSSPERSELQVIRIGAPPQGAAGEGAVWIAALPGEPFTEYGTRFGAEFQRRFAASPDWTLTCGYSNDCVGYFCTPEALRQGGYEADIAHGVYHRPAPFAENVESILLERTLGAAEDLLVAPPGEPRPLWRSLKTLLHRAM